MNYPKKNVDKVDREGIKLSTGVDNHVDNSIYWG